MLIRTFVAIAATTMLAPAAEAAIVHITHPYRAGYLDDYDQQGVKITADGIYPIYALYGLHVDDAGPAPRYYTISAPDPTKPGVDRYIGIAGLKHTCCNIIDPDDGSAWGSLHMLNAAGQVIRSYTFAPMANNSPVKITLNWNGGTKLVFGGDHVSINDLVITGVPEPTTWAMMIAGFGAIGASIRRRSKPAACRDVGFA